MKFTIFGLEIRIIHVGKLTMINVEKLAQSYAKEHWADTPAMARKAYRVKAARELCPQMTLSEAMTWVTEWFGY